MDKSQSSTECCACRWGAGSDVAPWPRLLLDSARLTRAPPQIGKQNKAGNLIKGTPLDEYLACHSLEAFRLRSNRISSSCRRLSGLRSRSLRRGGCLTSEQQWNLELRSRSVVASIICVLVSLWLCVHDWKNHLLPCDPQKAKATVLVWNLAIAHDVDHCVLPSRFG